MTEFVGSGIPGIPSHRADLPVDGNSIQQTKEVIVKIGKLHAIFWFLIVLSGIVWGFLFATSILGVFGSVPVALFGVLGTLVLAATVFALSKNNVVLVTRAVDHGDPETDK